ncbi:major facilitator superfamily transporter [Auriscalpium vulgare]|uniref:Major facilitator superfamily transporter n=1 Tax=Auriscalpium vulgare TaxID=40419 RepID=A0ACB8RRX1_9AGAM|nr:major facilitator superfamily transporter [Auriscalpium vulgare]
MEAVTVKSTDEETPLLSERPRPQPTPLPLTQILVLLLLQLSEPIVATSILPYINELIAGLDITGGDQRKVGYYAGLIESLYFAAEALTVLQWSRLSDHVGRKPVLLSGIAAMTLSILGFGLSRTFWSLVIWRCLNGALNGNIGVMKSMMAELTDETNMAQGFALMPVTWALGVTIGPFIGGVLSRPHDRFPQIFGNEFWVRYPYFLPCAVAAGLSVVSWFVAAVSLKETVHVSPRRAGPPRPAPTRTVTEDLIHVAEGAALEHEIPAQGPPPKTEAAPLPLSRLLTRPVVLSISNYAALALLDIALAALLPLFLSTPVALGGLGLAPAAIGLCLGTYGVMNGFAQFFFFAKAVNKWGAQRVFIMGMSVFILIFAIFPVANAVARNSSESSIAPYAIIFAQFLLFVIMDAAYGAIFMYVSTAAPNKRTLGATNGIAQTVTSVQRAIGPALSTSLFAFSLENNVMGGHFVYVVLILMSILAVGLATRLPRDTWKVKEEDL